MPIAKAIKQPIAKAILQPIAGASSASPLLDGLLAYFNLDESSGTRSDSHTNGYDLTDNNTVGSRTGQGGSGTAADFISTNSEYLSAPGGLVIPSTFSVSFWFLCDDFAADRAWLDFYRNNAGGSGGGVKVRTAATSGRIIGQVFDGTSATQWGASFQADPDASTWHHCYVEHDGTSCLLTLDDGTEVTGTGTMTQSTAAGWIGGLDAGTDVFQDGGMQCLGIYNRTLTAAERTWLATSPRLYADVEAYTG